MKLINEIKRRKKKLNVCLFVCMCDIELDRGTYLKKIIINATDYYYYYRYILIYVCLDLSSNFSAI